jgi:predicted P-loop ATPase
VDHPRQCGFAGTINPGSNGYLRDETGARRFWIVSCGEGWDATSQVNITKLDAARDHLWAEAVHRYRANEIWWLDTAELDANQAQAADLRQTDDPREPKIREFLKALAWVRMDQILGPDCLNISAERWTNGLRVEIGFVMSALKWRRRRKKLKNGDLEWRYYPMESEEEEEKEKQVVSKKIKNKNTPVNHDNDDKHDKKDKKIITLEDLKEVEAEMTKSIFGQEVSVYPPSLKILPPL